MLATPGQLPPPERDQLFAYEFKWDGVRVLAFCGAGTPRLLSRNGNDVSVAYPELRSLADRRVVLDGEVVAVDPSTGRMSFAALQPRMHLRDAARAGRLAEAHPVTYLVFDVLHLDGRSTTALTYVQRRQLLLSLELPGSRWAVPPSFTGGGPAVLATSLEQGMEGVLAKRLASVYTPGRRSGDWVKVKNVRAQEVLVVGWTPGQGNRAGTIGSLLLGVHGPDGVEYVGNVGTGFTYAVLRDLLSRLERLERPSSPLRTEPPARLLEGVRWSAPDLVGEVAFAEWTREGRLRHPTWRGLRPDKDADEVVRES